MYNYAKRKSKNSVVVFMRRFKYNRNGVVTAAYGRRDRKEEIT